MDKEVVAISTPNALVGIIPKILGFHPTGIVVVPIGDGPWARVDDRNPFDVAMRLRHLVHHWDQVHLVAYNADPAFTKIIATAAPALLPTVQVQHVLRVDDGQVYEGITDTCLGPIDTGPTGSLYDAVRVMPSRDSLYEEAQEITDTAVAERMAEAAHQAGRGAHAIAYLARAVDLNGGASPSMRDLHHRIQTSQP